MSLDQTSYDLCVIGGGINGAGVARDAAGRGLSVLLVEAKDLASGTSSASSKLIHGGLRYLEYFEFKMVRNALKERRVLQTIVPHLIRPQEFILPHMPGMRPYWMLDLGLFLYENLDSFSKTSGQVPRLPKSKGVKFNRHIAGMPLKTKLKKGFSYYDCWVDDARLVVSNAMDAAAHGATILTRTTCENIKSAEDGTWQLTLRDGYSHEAQIIQADAIINAAGPWVRDVLDHSGLGGADVPVVRRVKGSHIVVPRQYDGEHAYTLQQDDKRVVFAIPYEGKYTLIGTTEIELDEDTDPYTVKISREETEYLCDAFNASFANQITPADVVWSYSGVRPLFDDGSKNATEATRDYLIHRQLSEQGAPLLSIFGGKLTTYREVAEDAVNRLDQMQGRTPKPWTALKKLSGGNFKADDIDDFIAREAMAYPWMDRALLERYARSYGSKMIDIVGSAMDYEELGEHYGDGIYRCELEYLVAHEWVREVDDFLLRRSKLGLHISEKTLAKITRALPEIVIMVIG